MSTSCWPPNDPAGAVSDDIRANTALRLCLRTLDAADSQDVLGGPEAAHLPADRPGRAWLRRGDRLQLVQVATASGPEPVADGPGLVVRRIGEPWPDADDDGPLELDRLVDDAATAWADRPRPAPAWRPPLPERLLLTADGEARSGPWAGSTSPPSAPSPR